MFRIATDPLHGLSAPLEARLLQRAHGVRNILVAVGFSVGVYLTFVKFLNVMLPAGVLG